jgi:uncharacterized membrane protein
MTYEWLKNLRMSVWTIWLTWILLILFFICWKEQMNSCESSSCCSQKVSSVLGVVRLEVRLIASLLPWSSGKSERH